MLRTNEKDTEWHETFKCECKFGANICNNKQRGIKMNAGVNAKNELIKEYVIKEYVIKEYVEYRIYLES